MNALPLILRDIPNADYHANAGLNTESKRVSSSMVKTILGRNGVRQFVRKYLLKVCAPYKSKGLKTGSLLHALLAGTFDDEFTSAPECPHGRKTKDGGFKPYTGGAKYEEWLATVDLGGKDTYIPEELEQAQALVEHLREHKECREMIEADGISEGTLYGQIAGFDCQIRMDKCLKYSPTIIDWKTTGEPIGNFRRVSDRFGYHLQAAFYSMVYRDAFGKLPKFLFAVVETKEPFTATVFEYALTKDDEEDVEHAVQLMHKDLTEMDEAWVGVHPLKETFFGE